MYDVTISDFNVIRGDLHMVYY